MAFQHQLKHFRELKKLSMDELANDLREKYGLKINKSTISRWESGAEPKGKDVHYLAHYFKVNPTELMDLELDPPDNVIKFPELKEVKAPLFGDIAAGAMSMVEGVTTDNMQWVTIPAQFLGKYASCSDLFAMMVNGDSMDKVIPHGNVIVAKPMEFSQYKDGDIVIFSYNNEYSLKRYAPDDSEDYLIFKSESTNNDFKDIIIPKFTENNLKIYGKVVFYGTTL